MSFLEKHIKKRTRYTNTSSVAVKNSEASLEEKSNDDPRNTNNDNLYLLSTNDETGVITIESVLDSIAPEESLDSLDGSDNSLMMKHNRNDSPSNNDSTDSTRQREGEDIRGKKTVNESGKPKSSTPSPSSDVLPSLPESRT
uniref:Uncharacterized protein n=1 Tax=Daphnia galeata TaxID=27404 RepID=A0A8J2RJF3_9CRUS|nr:unnamed protein product [Daphnia galeata]